MRVNFSGQLGTNINGGLSNSTTIVSTPITLLNDPTQPLEASSKRYIDNTVSNLDANNIKTGTVDAARLPAYTGDMLVPSGSGTLALATSSVPPDVYSKVNVNSKGIVTSTATLNNDDIPVISFSKITADRPTTLSGYGISDGVSSNGGMLAGIVSLNNDPVQNLEASNKQYVDNVAAANYGIMVGDIIRRPSNVTPSGFLRCNGGQVDRTTYSALYAVIGDQYTIELLPGAGRPWTQQYLINNIQTGDLGSWSNLANNVPKAAHFPVVTKNRVYLLGGSNSNTHTAPINSDGTLGGWTNLGQIIPLGSGAKAVIVNNRLYTFEGNNSQLSSYVINSDGTIGQQDSAWFHSLTNFSTYGTGSQIIVIKNKIYSISSKGDLITYMTINANGSLSNWGYTNVTPVINFNWYNDIAVIKNYIYKFSQEGVASMYINADGTLSNSWSIVSSLPTNVGSAMIVVTKNYIYSIGGYIPITAAAVNNVYYAPINTDGTLGAWVTGTSLPLNIYNYSQCIVTSSKVYILGGRTTVETTAVYEANISGGLNDYSPYYNGSITPTEPGKFSLPDYTAQSTNGSYFYIKS